MVQGTNLVVARGSHLPLMCTLCYEGAGEPRTAERFRPFSSLSLRQHITVLAFSPALAARGGHLSADDTIDYRATASLAPQ